MAREHYERRSAEEWAALLEAQADSGLSQRVFCLQAGVALSTFRLWKRKLGGVGASASTVNASVSEAGFVPLFEPGPADGAARDEVAATGGPGADAAAGWQVDLDLGDGLRLTVRKVAG